MLQTPPRNLAAAAPPPPPRWRGPLVRAPAAWRPGVAVQSATLTATTPTGACQQPQHHATAAPACMQHRQGLVHPQQHWLPRRQNMAAIHLVQALIDCVPAARGLPQRARPRRHRWRARASGTGSKHARADPCSQNAKPDISRVATFVSEPSPQDAIGKHGQPCGKGVKWQHSLQVRWDASPGVGAVARALYCLCVHNSRWRRLTRGACGSVWKLEGSRQRLASALCQLNNIVPKSQPAMTACAPMSHDHMLQSKPAVPCVSVRRNSGCRAQQRDVV